MSAWSATSPTPACAHHGEALERRHLLDAALVDLLEVLGRLQDGHDIVGIDGKTVVLVDDVLYTGRTIRAALDALMDIGH